MCRSMFGMRTVVVFIIHCGLCLLALADVREPEQYNHFLQWTEEHNVCTMTQVRTPGDRGQQSGGVVNCHHQWYVDYFKKLLASPPTPFHRNISESVLNLYRDLQLSRRPIRLTSEYLTKRFNRRWNSRTSSGSKDILIHPITFAVHNDDIVSVVTPKIKAFGRVIPGNKSTYFPLTEEHAYYTDMQRSLFVLTYKKAGWDCLRHYEIMANGAVPLFVDIRHAPASALAGHPKRLLHQLLHFPGLSYAAHKVDDMTYQFDTLEYDWQQFDAGLYQAVVMSLLVYTQNVLSTSAVAKYFLDTIIKANQQQTVAKAVLPQKVLYLVHESVRSLQTGDYQVMTLLMGLQQVLGTHAVVDYPAISCIYKQPVHVNDTQYRKSRSKLYGGGFGFGHRVEVPESALQRDAHAIAASISRHEYDLIVLGSGHLAEEPKAKLRLWSLVCAHYLPHEVVVVHGRDQPMSLSLLSTFSSCAGHFFAREGFAPEFREGHRPQTESNAE